MADSNQVAPATQPSTQPLLSGRTLTQKEATAEASTSSNMPQAVAPVYGGRDGGGNKATGIMINRGIGASVAPERDGAASTPQPSGVNVAPATQPAIR